MDKDIGAEELVYAKIEQFIEQKASISIQFKHPSGKLADHCWSRDKDKYAHCYAQLEVGQHYIIVTKHVGRHRWVWMKALLVTKTEQDKFREIAGLCPNEKQMTEAIEWLRAKRNPPKTPSLTDMLEF